MGMCRGELFEDAPLTPSRFSAFIFQQSQIASQFLSLLFIQRIKEISAENRF